MPTKITLRDNGPLVIEGEIEIVTQGGDAIANRGARNALCRCGSSSSKPFCDGTHAKIGFSSAPPEAEKAEGA